MVFKYPNALWFLFIIPVLIIFYIYTLKRYKAGISFPSIRILKKISKRRFPNVIKHVLFALKLFAILCLIVAAAKPRGENEYVDIERNIIDIMLIMDTSSSMNAVDIDGKTRFMAAKEVIKEFVRQSKTNRIGLIAFAGESYTMVPLTTDYALIQMFIDELEIGDLDDGTAIGLALANGSERLKKSEAKSKVMILLTDGDNTASGISPASGTQMAKELGIKVYTIGLGKTGKVMFRQEYKDTITGEKRYIDKETTSHFNTVLLEHIAKETDGRFFRVFTHQELLDVYNEINKLEKTKVMLKTRKVTEEYDKPFILMSLVFLFLFLIIDNLLFRVIP